MRLTDAPLVQLKSLDRFPGYLFGSDGSVWSSKVKGWRKLRASSNGRYLHVSLTYAFRQQKTFDVHPLICEAFHGPCPDGMECCHKDGNPRNIAADNLRWGTHSDNQLDKHYHDHHKAKLTADDAIHVRRLLGLGFRERDVASAYRVSQSTVKHIRHRRSWAMV